jgi:hypothetical protein
MVTFPPTAGRLKPRLLQISRRFGVAAEADPPRLVAARTPATVTAADRVG